MPVNLENGKNLGVVVSELKEEFKEFASTRLSMFRSEMREKISGWKSAAPVLLGGAVLLGTAWLLLSAALVAAIYVAFRDNPWAACIALLIVGFVYLLFGAMAVLSAMRQWREAGVVPQRTLRVLKDDQIWISDEARSQL